jgi:hypothetical protein
MKGITPQIQKPLELLKAKGWIWKVAIAGLCGSVTHTLLMLVKTKLGILDAFQPYQSLQIALSYWTGEYVHPLLPWVISYANGSTAAGFAFANLYRHLPGASGPIKGFIAGVLGWLVMDMLFFPLLSPMVDDRAHARPRPSLAFVMRSQAEEMTGTLHLHRKPLAALGFAFPSRPSLGLRQIF